MEKVGERMSARAEPEAVVSAGEDDDVSKAKRDSIGDEYAPSIPSPAEGRSCSCSSCALCALCALWGVPGRDNWSAIILVVVVEAAVVFCS